eukprot:jgi/Tetstr1/450124/TSEL_037166.t1
MKSTRPSYGQVLLVGAAAPAILRTSAVPARELRSGARRIGLSEEEVKEVIESTKKLWPELMDSHVTEADLNMALGLEEDDMIENLREDVLAPEKQAKEDEQEQQAEEQARQDQQPQEEEDMDAFRTPAPLPIATRFVALHEWLPYVHVANHDFNTYLALARNHAEAIDKAFRFRLAFLRSRLNEIKRDAGVDVDVAAVEGVAAKAHQAPAAGRAPTPNPSLPPSSATILAPPPPSSATSLSATQVLSSATHCYNKQTFRAR